MRSPATRVTTKGRPRCLPKRPERLFAVLRVTGLSIVVMPTIYHIGFFKNPAEALFMRVSGQLADFERDKKS